MTPRFLVLSVLFGSQSFYLVSFRLSFTPRIKSFIPFRVYSFIYRVTPIMTPCRLVLPVLFDVLRLLKIPVFCGLYPRSLREIPFRGNLIPQILALLMDSTVPFNFHRGHPKSVVNFALPDQLRPSFFFCR